MRLIANKPCSFGGQRFYIGDVIPANLVADAKMQEKLGVVTIAHGIDEVSGTEPGTFFTQEQVDKMIVEAVEGFSTFDGTIPISVRGEADGDNQQKMAIPANPEEIQEFFSIIQLNAEEGAKAIAEVKSENVLILLHAADSRKTIKNAAKERAGNLFSTNDNTHESTGGNEPTDAGAEGDDA